MRSRTFTGIMTAIAYLNAARLGPLACTSVKVVVALATQKRVIKPFHGEVQCVWHGMTRILTCSLGVVSSVAAENYGLT